MVRLKIKEDVVIPGTNIILEKGDIIEVIPKEEAKKTTPIKRERKRKPVVRASIKERKERLERLSKARRLERLRALRKRK